MWILWPCKCKCLIQFKSFLQEVLKPRVILSVVFGVINELQIQHLRCIRNSHPEVFCKKDDFKFSQNLQENACAWVSFQLSWTLKAFTLRWREKIWKTIELGVECWMEWNVKREKQRNGERESSDEWSKKTTWKSMRQFSE